MKHISGLKFEIKTPKLSKQKAAEILTAHKLGKIYLLKGKPESGRIEMKDIAGFINSLVPLNNKTFVRIEFEKRDDINDVPYDFIKLPADGYVLVPV